MADKVFKLSLEQLNDIVSDAVANAIKKLDGIEIVSKSSRTAFLYHSTRECPKFFWLYDRNCLILQANN